MKRSPLRRRTGTLAGIAVFLAAVVAVAMVAGAAPAEAAGDPWRGQQVFHDRDTGGCIRCHAVAGLGGAIGPDLTLIGRRRSPEWIRSQILNPPSHRKVAGDRRHVRLQLATGATVEGALIADGRSEWTLVDVEGRTNRVPVTAVRGRTQTFVLSMPTDYGARLTAQQLSDVTAYCATLESDPRKRVRRAVPHGFESLFNGRNLSGFKAVPSWRADKGVLRHEGEGDHLWHTRALGDFELTLEWRWPDPPKFEAFPVIDGTGYEVKQADGSAVVERVLDAGDSGVLLRGLFKAQANLFCYPVGSGEFWEYREESKGEPRQSFTPLKRADRPIGQWNEMRIRLVGDRVWVGVNGVEVIRDCRLPGIPPRGPIGFQHEHGGLELRNIWVKELRQR